MVSDRSFIASEQRLSVLREVDSGIACLVRANDVEELFLTVGQEIACVAGEMNDLEELSRGMSDLGEGETHLARARDLLPSFTSRLETLRDTAAAASSTVANISKSIGAIHDASHDIASFGRHAKILTVNFSIESERCRLNDDMFAEFLKDIERSQSAHEPRDIRIHTGGGAAFSVLRAMGRHCFK